MRTIVEEKDYKKQIQALRVDWKRLDEALRQVATALCQIPDLFPAVPNTGEPGLRRLKLVGYSGVPPLSIFFSHTATEVHLHWAEIIDEE